MIKKFIVATVLLLMVAAQASAKEFTMYESCGSLSYRSSGMNFKGNTQLYGNLKQGMAVFDESLYFHFDTVKKTPSYGTAGYPKGVAFYEKIAEEISRFGDEDISNTVPIYTFEGSTEIFPINDEQGNEYYLLSTETGGGGRIVVIGARPSDGKWVKYFEISSSDVRDIFGSGFYLSRDFYAEGDSIVIVCKNSAGEIGEIYYKWDSSRNSFNQE